MTEKKHVVVRIEGSYSADYGPYGQLRPTAYLVGGGIRPAKIEKDIFIRVERVWP